MHHLTRIAVAALVATRPYAAEPPPLDQGPLGMDELVRLVLANDPGLEELRIELGVSEGRAKAIRYWDDPEVRFYYTEKGDQRVPDPYSETITQTRTESGSETRSSSGTSVRNSSETRTGGKDGTEVRGERRTETTSETRRDSISSRESEVTTREYIPRRDGVTIRDTTRVQSGETAIRTASGSARSSSVERRTDEPGPVAVRGSESTRESQTTRTSGRVTRVEETDRFFAQSPYEGSERYSMQLRLQPRNPWEVSRLLRQARAETSVAEFELQTAQAGVAAEVRREYRAVAGATRELEVARERRDLCQRDLDYFTALEKSGAPVLRRVSEKRAALARENVRLRELQGRAESLRSGLALRAGLSDPARILVVAAPVPLIDFAGVNTNAVIEAAAGIHPELVKSRLELKSRKLGLAAARAARIPWFTVLAVEAGYEEQYGDKVSDDYGVFAGVSLPVFSWMDEGLGAEERAAADGLKRRIQRLQDQFSGQIESQLRRLAAVNASLAEYRREVAAEGERLIRARKEIEVTDADSHTAGMELEQTLLELRKGELEVEQQQADAIYTFEQALGADLDILFAAPSPNISR
ncbi:MAG: TolC family protein [Kiritimatiellia bacterium]